MRSSTVRLHLGVTASAITLNVTPSDSFRLMISGPNVPQPADSLVSCWRKWRGYGVHGAFGFNPVRCLGFVVIAVVVALAGHLENEAVASRHKCDALVKQTIAHICFRNSARQLTANRNDGLV